MIDYAIIGNYRNSIWEGLPHIFYQALHSKWIPSLSHSLRPLFPTCTLAPSLFQTAPSITEQQGTMPRHFRATCSRGRFRSAPGHSEPFLILDGFWAFVGHNLMIRITILVSLANLYRCITREVKHYNMMKCEDLGLISFLILFSVEAIYIYI